MTDPLVRVLSLGGTITMTPTESGAVAPTLGGDALLGAVAPALRSIRVTAQTLGRTPGAALTPHLVLDAVRAAAAAIRDGAHGVVVVQGTDTMEESAYLADLVWRAHEPVVFTGAMRPAGALGADGPANLAAAIRTAADPEARDRGVLVVMNDEIHAAHRVRKVHAGALQAFESGEFGLLGRVVEGLPWFAGAPVGSGAPPWFAGAPVGSGAPPWFAGAPVGSGALPYPSGPAFVPLLETHLGDDGGALRALLDTGLDGAVIAAYGVGHVSPALADTIEKAAAKIPVVLATRTGAGSTLRAAYDFPGSEADLIGRGVITAGRLNPRQARLLLWLLLASGTPPAEIPSAIVARGGGYAERALSWPRPAGSEAKSVAQQAAEPIKDGARVRQGEDPHGHPLG
ncbi:asparaginase [Nonomuraea sp. NPDC050540]|uniref:asparaginase n=1 Tax=Nonomuraea sp. NPDC050540 TaxID=3364367 RepID=UPI0037BBC87C